MTREETSSVLSVLKATYPNYYKDLNVTEMTEMVDIWSELFVDDDVNLVKVSLKELLKTCKFPPTIADIKQKMYDLTTQETLPTDLWDSLKRAISNSAYNSVEEFEKLPEECKMFIKTPQQLKELSQNDSEVNNTVVKGQFLKQIEIIKARIKDEKQMLPEARQIRNMALQIGQDVNLLN